MDKFWVSIEFFRILSDFTELFKKKKVGFCMKKREGRTGCVCDFYYLGAGGYNTVIRGERGTSSSPEFSILASTCGWGGRQNFPLITMGE